jgi:hypothetical protein
MTTLSDVKGAEIESAGAVLGSRTKPDRLSVFLPYLLAGVIALGALVPFTYNNDFPVYYHPDEQSKVDQVAPAAQPRNFNHPLLLIESANLARKLLGADPADARQVAIAGRAASAALAALAVFSLAMAGYVSYGRAGLLLVGATMALCPPVLIYAHYLKEDTALIAGIALAMLGARLVLASTTWRAQLLSTLVLGFGAAMACSAKYVGAVAIVPSVFSLLLAKAFRWWVVPARLVAFGTVLVAAILFINARAFAGFLPPTLKSEAREKIVAEFKHGTTGQNEVTLDRPNAFALRIASSELMPHTWILLGAGAVAVVVRRRVTRWGIALASFAATLLAALSFNAIPFPRHALPITMLAYFASAAGAAAMARLAAARHATQIMGAVLAVVIVCQGWRCDQFLSQFRDDSRQRLREWVLNSVPRDASFAIDRFAMLDSPGDPWRFPQQSKGNIKVARTRQFVADEGPFEVLPRRGFDYVVISEPAYQRYFFPGVHAVAGQEDLFTRRRQFYTDLLAHGDLVWSSVPNPSSHAYANQELRVYRVNTVH